MPANFRGRIRPSPSEVFAMRHEVHLHADIPILEGVSRRQLEQAFAPLLEYLDADGLADVKSLEPDEPGFKYDEKELMLYRLLDRRDRPQLPRRARSRAREPRPVLLRGGGGRRHRSTTRTASRSPSSSSSARRAQAIHEAQRRCMVEDVAAILGAPVRQGRSRRGHRAGERAVRPRLEGKGLAAEEARARVRDATRASRKNLH